MIRRLAILGLAWGLAWAPASTWGLSIISASRQVHARAELVPYLGAPDPPDEESQSTSGTEPFAALVQADVTDSFFAGAGSSARQESSIRQPSPGISLDTMISGRAIAGAYGSTARIDGYASSESAYALTFELETERSYVLHAMLTVAEFTDSPAAFADSQVTLELRRGTGDLIQQLVLESEPPPFPPAPGSPPSRIERTLDVTGRLLPGMYLLQITAQASASHFFVFGSSFGGSDGDATFEVEFGVVPEPAPVVTLAIGLAALAGRRKLRS